jgi:hypothetical protein
MILDLRSNSVLKSPIFETLNNISYKRRSQFNEIIGNISSNFEDNLDWWVEQPASRNISQSNLFYQFCCLYLIDGLIRSGTHLDKIISDSPAFCRILRILKKKQNMAFEIQGPEGAFEQLQLYFINIIKSIIVALIALKRKWFQFRAAKLTLDISEPQEKHDLVLIDIFVVPGFVTKDRYYNGLWGLLSPKDKKKTYFVPTIVMMEDRYFKDTYKSLRSEDRNFLIKEDYLKLSDLLFGFYHLYRIFFINIPNYKLLGVDFSLLIKEDLLSYKGFNNSLEGILNYRFGKRLKEQSFKLSTVINWWEGQPMDKGWNLGFNTFFPNATTKGYLGTVPYQYSIHLYPTKSEIENKVAPNELVMIGRQFINDIQIKHSKYRIDFAPAFRFTNLWEDKTYPEHNTGRFRIVIALPISLKESFWIIEQLIVSFNRIEKNDYEFVIRVHPATDIEIFKRHYGKNWPHYFLLDKGLVFGYNNLPDLLITGLSAISLETLVLGVPVIILEYMCGLAPGPIPNSVPNQLWRKCRSPKGILKAIHFFKNSSSKDLINNRDLSLKLKKGYFEPVTKEGTYKLLNFQV